MQDAKKSNELFPRSSGVLLHPTSLPGPFGVGDLGPQAHAFVQFLADARQSIWQMLPLGPTGYGDSPYQSFSAFAGNPLLISFDRLIERGYLHQSVRTNPPPFSLDAVEYDRVLPWKRALLAEAFVKFDRSAGEMERSEFEEFCQQQAGWLDNFALFIALKESQPHNHWSAWDRDLIARRPAALDRCRSQLAEPIQRCRFEQFEFHRQWRELYIACHKAGIRLMGDMPIYVSQDSADAWSHPELFEFDADGNPTVVAGVPPDYFSKTGQLWGNPIYRWREHQRTDFSWWVERFSSIFRQFDAVRVDHFRGFEAFWQVPAGEKTAVSGEWIKAPGMALFEAIEKNLGKLAIVAENLGLITPEVEALRRRFDYPGMSVVQFGYGSDEAGALQFRPENYSEDTVAYTGTHDNDTLLGWLAGGTDASTRTAKQIEQERARVIAAFGADRPLLPLRIMQEVMASKANTVILPLQDILGVGGTGRMNRPSIAEGNWRWRFRNEQLAGWRRNWLARMTRKHDRV